MLWAAIPALLRDALQRQRDPDVSLMLVYVAQLTVLAGSSTGRGRIRQGFNFPQTKTFADAALLPILIEGYRAQHRRSLIALAVRRWRLASSCCSSLRGLPDAASRGDSRRPRRATPASPSRGTIWIGTAASAARWRDSPACAEVAGPLGQLTAVRPRRLRLRRDHRRVRRPPAPDRHRLREPADGAALHRRRAGAVST